VASDRHPRHSFLPPILRDFLAIFIGPFFPHPPRRGQLFLSQGLVLNTCTGRVGFPIVFFPLTPPAREQLFAPLKVPDASAIPSFCVKWPHDREPPLSFFPFPYCRGNDLFGSLMFVSCAYDGWFLSGLILFPRSL